MPTITKVAIPTSAEEATAKVKGVFWDEDEFEFVLTIKHNMGKMRGTSLVRMEPDLSVVHILAQNVSGWLTVDERELMFSLAVEVKDPIVEIGSWQGKSTVVLGWASRLGFGPPVYAIDPHTGGQQLGGYLKDSMGTFGLLKRNLEMAGLTGTVYPMEMTSKEAVVGFEDGSLGLVFIDGDHDVPAEDFDLWYPKLKPGGFLLMHDAIGWPMVEKAVSDRMVHGPCEYVTLVDSIAVGQKPK